MSYVYEHCVEVAAVTAAGGAGQGGIGLLVSSSKDPDAPSQKSASIPPKYCIYRGDELKKRVRITGEDKELNVLNT